MVKMVLTQHPRPNPTATRLGMGKPEKGVSSGACRSGIPSEIMRSGVTVDEDDPQSLPHGLERTQRDMIKARNGEKAVEEAKSPRGGPEV